MEISHNGNLESSICVKDMGAGNYYGETVIAIRWLSDKDRGVSRFNVVKDERVKVYRDNDYTSVYLYVTAWTSLVLSNIYSKDKTKPMVEISDVDVSTLVEVI